MNDLKSRWFALIDQYSAEQDCVTSTEKTCPTVAAKVDTRTKTNPKWLALIDKALKETADESGNTVTQSDDELETLIVSEQENDSETETQIVLPIELPIYEAAPGQLDYWHAFGSNIFLQNLLRRYGLDFSSPNLHAYDKFKIGFDEKRHVAIFAISEKCYHIIQFNETNFTPVNFNDADLVLREIQRLYCSTKSLL